MSLPKYLAEANQLIAGLPAELRTLFVGRCELVSLQHDEILTKAGTAAEYAFFPIDSFVAAICPVDDTAVQIGLIGHEGMVIGSLVIDVKVSVLTSLVQGAGRAYRIHCRNLQGLIRDNPKLRESLQIYAASSVDQLAKNMACAGVHTAGQRLARWLLVARDAAHSDELALTHKTLAFMLGIRRERVTTVASLFQKQGLISCRRGEVTILDEAGLLAKSCNCYEAQTGMAGGQIPLVDPSVFTYKKMG